MKRLTRILLDSLCILLLLEMLAACTNAEPDINIAAQLQRNSGKSSDTAAIESGRRTLHTPKQNAIADGTRYYQVREGDTLYSIGRRSKLGLKTLARWNSIAAPYTIYVGQKIKLFTAPQADAKPLRRAEMPPKIKPKFSGQVQKERISSQKKLTLSIDNRKVLKFYCDWPINGKVLKNFSQSGNKGIDIATGSGQSVKAAASGKVVYSGQGLLGYGNVLIIKHDEEFLSAYGNNSKLLVIEGQQVKTGQIIAEVGTGPGDKAALHFEIRKDGKPVDPIDYLPKK
jgi:lipoprotein NlpD